MSEITQYDGKGPVPSSFTSVKRRILVTGAAGNIGQRVANHLSDQYDLVLTDAISLAIGADTE